MPLSVLVSTYHHTNDIGNNHQQHTNDCLLNRLRGAGYGENGRK